MNNRYAWMVAVIATGMILIAASNRKSALPQARVNLLRQNVFYIGVDNPIEISVDGVAPENIHPLILGGSIAGDSGRYIVRVNEGMKASITVVVNRNGRTDTCGKYEYRIKRIPDPVTYINNVRLDGVILREDLPNITGVFTRMENFDFDGAFKPQSFSMSVIEDGEWKEYKAVGPALTDEMKTALTRVVQDDKIIFHNVMTKGPAGDVRHVSSVTITVR